MNVDLTSPKPESRLLDPESETDQETEDKPMNPRRNYALFQQLGKKITNICCTTCRKPRVETENEVVLLFKQWVGETDRMQGDLDKLDETKKAVPSSVVSCNKRGCTASRSIECGASNRPLQEV